MDAWILYLRYKYFPEGYTFIIETETRKHNITTSHRRRRRRRNISL